MGILGAADIGAMIADLAVAGATVEVVFAPVGGPSYTTAGIRDRDVVELLGGDGPGVAVADDVIQVQAGALPGLAVGSPITIAAAPFTVHALQPYGDGAMIRIFPRKP
jgi:hypothetical protein